MSTNTKMAEALQDGLSVCNSVSMAAGRRVVIDGCVLYAQTEEWCQWAKKEVRPRLQTALNAQDAEQSAKAVPALYVGLIERLMRLSTRLGIAYEGGVEHFAASLEDRLYAICRGAESLLNSVATPPAPEAKSCLITGTCKHGSWCSEVYCQEHCQFVEAQAAPEAQQPAGQELPHLPEAEILIWTDEELQQVVEEVRAPLWKYKAVEVLRAALAQRREPLTVPHPGSPEAKAMIDSELALRDWPANHFNAARAGYEACRKLAGLGIGATTGEQHG